MNPNTPRAAGLPANCALYIAEGLSMSGRIELKDNRPVVIAGDFDGEIEIAGELMVEPTARITNGPVRAGQLTLQGRMHNVSLTEIAELLDVRAGGLLQGERVRYAELVLARGAQINASLEATTQPASLDRHAAIELGARPAAVPLSSIEGSRAYAPAPMPPVLTEVAPKVAAPAVNLEDLSDLGSVEEPNSPFGEDGLEQGLRPRLAAG